jgi:hypothetical protein
MAEAVVVGYEGTAHTEVNGHPRVLLAHGEVVGRFHGVVVHTLIILVKEQASGFSPVMINCRIN